MCLCSFSRGRIYAVRPDRSTSCRLQLATRPGVAHRRFSPGPRAQESCKLCLEECGRRYANLRPRQRYRLSTRRYSDHQGPTPRSFVSDRLGDRRRRRRHSRRRHRLLKRAEESTLGLLPHAHPWPGSWHPGNTVRRYRGGHRRRDRLRPLHRLHGAVAKKWRSRFALVTACCLSYFFCTARRQTLCGSTGCAEHFLADHLVLNRLARGLGQRYRQHIFDAARIVDRNTFNLVC